MERRLGVLSRQTVRESVQARAATTVTPCALQLNIETHFRVIRGVRVDGLMEGDAGRVPLPGTGRHFPPESANEPDVHDTPLLLIITISTTKHKLIACLEVRLRPFPSHEKSSLETEHIRGKSVPGSCGIAAQHSIRQGQSSFSLRLTVPSSVRLPLPHEYTRHLKFIRILQECYEKTQERNKERSSSVFELPSSTCPMTFSSLFVC
jgi:hypothetical protein